MKDLILLPVATNFFNCLLKFISCFFNKILDNSSSGSGSMGSSGTRKKNDGRRRKKGPTNIICFDDDDNSPLSHSVKSVSRPFDFSSAPPTCLSSPVTVPDTSTERKSCSDASSPVAISTRQESEQV